MYEELEVVVLRRDLPEHELLAGDVGTVVGKVSAAAPNAPGRYPRLLPVLPPDRACELLDEER